MRTSIRFSGILLFLLAALFIVQAPAAQAQLPLPNSTQFDITGFLQEATLDPVSIADPHAGGTLRVNGHFVVVPRDTIVILSANALTWQELFTQAPAPYGLTTAVGRPETGLALNDIPQPLTTYEVQVVGNQIVTPTANIYIAGLIYISQEGLNTGAGYINYINYTAAEMRVGGRIDDPNTGTRVRINDPIGRFGRAQSPDPRWTVDPENPTITAATGYPMGLPDVLTDPTLTGADDRLRPQKNRPKDTLTGLFLTTFTMPANTGCGATPGPDPCMELPLEVGDFISYSGILVRDGPNPTAMPAPGEPNTTYISAFAINDNVAFYTAPGTDPAYVLMEVFILEAGGIPAIVGEIGKRTRFEGFSTDPSRNIHLFGIDYDPVTGAEIQRDYGSIDVDCGLTGPGCTTKISGNAAKGRWRFRPPANILTGPGELAPGTVSKANKLAMLTAFLPPVREVRAAVSTGEARLGSCLVNPTTGLTTCNTDFVIAPQPLLPTGITANQYHAPILEYILPENRPGTPMVANNFESFGFLFNGGYTSTQRTLGGELNPFPIVWLPGMVPPYTPALNSVFVTLANATIGVNSIEQLNALPLDQRFVAFPSAAVSFTSSNPAVAAVNQATGLVTGISPGTAIITATAVSGATTVTGTATITVTAPVDTFNLTVQSPPGAIATTNVSSISLARGTSGTVLLSVMSAAPGSYVVNATATSANFTSVVAMTVIGASTSTTGVNTIATYLLNVTNTGIPTFIGNSVTVTTTTTVTGVYPSVAMLLPAETIQFTSSGIGAVTWASSNGTVGTIDPATGLFNASAPGNTTITATNATGSGTAHVIVGAARYTTPPLVAGYNQIIVPVQSDPAFNASRLLQLVTGQNPGVSGSKVVRFNATSQLFETFDPFAGLIDFTIDASQGYFVNLTAPAANISIVGTLTGITQPPAVINTITVTPATAALVVSDTQPFVATALDLVGNPIAATFTWNSSNTTVGTIDAAGVFTALAAGTTTVNATNGSIVGSASVTVTAAPTAPSVLTTINVTPANPTLVVGGNQLFNAAGVDQFGNPIATAITVTWISSDTTVGTIDATGNFTANAAGTALVLAINGSVVGSTLVTVNPAPVANGTIAGTVTDNATTTAIAGATVTAGSVTATTDANGSYSISIAPGTYTISASAAGFVTQSIAGIAVTSGATATQNFALDQVPILKTITVTPVNATVAVGNTTTFAATTLDQFGNLIAAIVTWLSSDANVGTIDPNTGVFTANATGTAVVNATSGTVVGSANVTVT